MRLTTNRRNCFASRFTRGLLLGLALVALWLVNCQAAHAVAITWNVAGGGVWDIATPNWTGGSTVFTNGDDVTFNNAAGGVINLTADRAPLSTTVSAASGTYTFSNNNVTSGTLNKSGGGTLVMNSEYTASGAIVLTGGTLQLGSSNRLADTATIGGNFVGTWDMNGFDETIQWAAAGGVTTTNMGNLTVVHGFADRSAGGAVMSGSGSLTFGPGHGISIIQDTHLYTGGTFINNGLVALYTGNGNQFPVTGPITVASGATYSLDWHNAGGNTRTLGALLGSGSIFSSNNNLVNNTLQPGNGGASSTFGGVFSGAGSLDKVGAGTLTLNGNNTYTGTTLVTGGALIVNGTTGPGQGNYSVASGATLGGNGTINLAGGNSVTIAGGGTLAPGNSAGTLTINGNLILNNTSILDFELGNPLNPSTSDTVVILGVPTLDGNLTLDGVLNVTELAGFGTGTYQLFSYTGGLINNGLTVTDSRFTVNLDTPGIVALDVLIPVPEPSTLALLGLGAIGLAIRTRCPRNAA